MAVVESHLFSRMRGSTGDLTYYQGHSNRILSRAKIVSPAYPHSVGQVAIQEAFSSASDEWVNLSQADRDAWHIYGATIETRKSFARSPLTGRQAFMQVISYAIFINDYYGLPPVLDYSPPVTPGFLTFGPISPIVFTTPDHYGCAFSITNPNPFPIVVDSTVSAPLGVTINKFSGPFPFGNHQGLAIAASSTFNYQKIVSSSYSGHVAFFRFRAVNRVAPFTLSAEFVFRCVVILNPP